MRLNSVWTVMLCSVAAAVAADELPRRGYLGAEFRGPAADRRFAEVRVVKPGSAAQNAGLQAGDRITAVNGAQLTTRAQYERSLLQVAADQPITLAVDRKGAKSSVKVTPPATPHEKWPGIEVIYTAVKNARGDRVRTVITRPERAQGKLPAIVLAAWLSCDSVEYPFGPEDGFGRLLAALVQNSGMVVVRTEKPGIGDSEGICSQTDFQTELSGYRAALRAAKGLEYVDPGRVFILGMSNGGGYAPLLADGETVAGYIITGGWSYTWLEHMLWIERTQLTLAGKTPAEVAEAMKSFSELYTDYLIGKKTPGEVIAQKPHLKAVWGEPPDSQYGRPAAFYQQLQDLNLGRVWQQVSAPVLAVHGEFDSIMSPAEVRVLVAELNRRKPGRARFELIPRMTHSFGKYPTLEQAFAEQGQAEFAEEVPRLMIEWLKQQAGR